MPPEQIRGILTARPSLDMPPASTFRVNKQGETYFLLYCSTRRKATPLGMGYYATCSHTASYVKGQYLPRSFLLRGIRLDTVIVANGPRLVRLFPGVMAGVLAAK